MNIIDFTFYKFYLFGIGLRNKFKLNQTDMDMRFSAFLLFSLYITVLAVAILSCLGLLFENSISAFLKTNHMLIIFVIGINVPFIIRKKFYLHWNVSKIKSQYHGMHRKKRWIYNILLLFILIGVPIISFVTFRLYVFGYV